MINSRSNTKIKLLKSLAQKKYRDETGLYVAEGVKTVKEAAENGGKIRCIFATEETAPAFEKYGFELLLTDPSVLNGASDSVNPQGVSAVIEKPANVPFKAYKRSLLLDGVSDPGNLGTIIRTAAASGFTDIYLTETADIYNPKTVRASAGGIFRVRTFRAERKEILETVNLPVVCADMHGQSVFGFCKPEAFCLALGNEANGLSEEVLKKSRYRVCVPMENGVESLNVGVSAGILMYLLK